MGKSFFNHNLPASYRQGQIDVGMVMLRRERSEEDTMQLASELLSLAADYTLQNKDVRSNSVATTFAIVREYIISTLHRLGYYVKDIHISTVKLRKGKVVNSFSIEYKRCVS